ncbi:MAG: transporter [Acidobacteria bacterium]|nr:transporter [Acidobacteriota bacterium]
MSQRISVAMAIFGLGAIGLSPSLAAQTPEVEVESLIRDNSFLVEEAYNQEDHVVQEINNFIALGPERDWLYVFTQEWPLGGMKNQLSYTLSLTDPGNLGGDTGLGDSLVNYRYQVAGGGPERVAFAPRVSLVIPTGDEKEERGQGAFGILVNLPLSIELTDSLVSHSNAGGAFIPSAKDAAGNKADVTDYFLGQSLVWLARPTLNAVFEAVYTWEEEVIGPGTTERSSSFVINPGVRWAINRPSGLQIVPGICVPIGVGPSRGDEALFLYLSFEHPFGKRNSP